MGILKIARADATAQITTYNFSFTGALALVGKVDNDVTLGFSPELSPLMKFTKTGNKKGKGTLRHMNMNIRASLSTTGKAIYRFMLGHKAQFDYRFSVDIMHKATAPNMRLDNFKPRLTETLTQLEALHFLSHSEIKKELGNEWVCYRRTIAGERLKD